MDKTFQFVDSTMIDGVTRKLMRSHVMKGKNAGKTVHRRSRFDLNTGRIQRDYSSVPRDLVARHEAVEKRSLKEVGPIPRNRGNVLRTFRFPVELAEGSLKTIDQCKYDDLLTKHCEWLLRPWYY